MLPWIYEANDKTYKGAFHYYISRFGEGARGGGLTLLANLADAIRGHVPPISKTII